MTLFLQRKLNTNLITHVIFLLSLFINQPLTAQTLSEDDLSPQQLLQALQQRDIIINNLMRRVEQLERRLDARDALAESAPAAAQPQPAQQAAAPARAATPQPPRPSTAQTAPAPRPGAFEVDEDAAERALERSLTQAWVLLLRSGVLELEPFFSYARDVKENIFLAPDDGQLIVDQREIRSNTFDFGLRSRYGLPWDSQLEFSLPYRIVDQTVLTPNALVGFDEAEDSGSALGDLSIGIAKTLAREQGWRPDFVGRLTWNTNTGDRTDNDIALGSGFNEFRISFSALKRQDPLVFTGSIGYTKAFEEDNIEPGDQVTASLGFSLATSPETSLNASLQQAFVQETKINGRRVTGSDQVSSSVVFGYSWILDRGILLSLSTAVGLTDDAADYSINLSLPIQFW